MPGPGNGRGPRGFLTEEEKGSAPKLSLPLVRRILSYLVPYRLQFALVFLTLRGDRILGSVKHEMPVTIREITLGKNHSWNRIQIEDIDISRQSYFVLIKRDNELLRPRDDLVLQEGDKAILLSRGKDRKLEREYDA